MTLGPQLVRLMPNMKHTYFNMSQIMQIKASLRRKRGYTDRDRVSLNPDFLNAHGVFESAL